MKLKRLIPLTMLLCPAILRASESDLGLPTDRAAVFSIFGFSLPSLMILYIGLVVAALGMLFGWLECAKLRKLPAHKSMLDISTLIYGTCKTYLLQQGRLLLLLEVFIGATMVYYFGFLKHNPASTVVLILAWSLVGIGGSFAVAWFGMLINNIANSRMAFAALRGRALPVSEIPTRSGMSIGVLLISTELMLMIAILVFVPPALA
ncbi:MAG: sodium/proton-translocating pyrophosphatase, partial [Verrucomicrobiota bacterium]